MLSTIFKNEKKFCDFLFPTACNKPPLQKKMSTFICKIYRRPNRATIKKEQSLTITSTEGANLVKSRIYILCIYYKLLYFRYEGSSISS